jgi:hypothetical protein
LAQGLHFLRYGPGRWNNKKNKREREKERVHGGEAGLPEEPPPGKRAAGRYPASAGGLRNPLLALLPELFFFFR